METWNRFSSYDVIVKNVLVATRSLSTFERNCDIFYRLDGARRITEVMRMFPMRESIQNNAVVAMSNVWRGCGERREQMISLSTVEDIIVAIRQFDKIISWRLQSNACRALHSITLEAKGCEKLVELDDGVHSIVCLVVRSQAYPNIFEDSLEVLLHLTSPQFDPQLDKIHLGAMRKNVITFLTDTTVVIPKQGKSHALCFALLCTLVPFEKYCGLFDTNSGLEIAMLYADRYIRA